MNLNRRFLLWPGAIRLALPVFATTCLAQPAPPAPAATPQASPTQQESVILGHLNSALDWYRAEQASTVWVRQPSDEYFKSSLDDLAKQVLRSSFDYGQAMVAVIGTEAQPAVSPSAGNSRAQRLASLTADNAERLGELKNQESELTQQFNQASPADQPALAARRAVVQAAIALDSAVADTLKKSLTAATDAGESSQTATLAGQIDALRQAEPAAFAASNSPAAKGPSVPATFSSSTGLVDGATALFSLMEARRRMDVLIWSGNALEAAAKSLAGPISAKLRTAIEEGNAAAGQATSASGPGDPVAARTRIEGLAAQIQEYSVAVLPLRQEAAGVQNAVAILNRWKTSAAKETDVILGRFFVRAITLGVALLVLVAISEIWRRATFKYVHDARRRRQILLIRRFTTSTLMVGVVVMVFVGNFSSIATFAGFITAGIAVALQSIILSVAAYFFLVGRYGVRVGDRVTVSGITGDVIDIGLIRVFLMELAGTGVDLHPTGRVVVLANSNLFSTSPLYKQLPGTDYAWHEVYVTIVPEADPAPVEERLLRAVESVYQDYRLSLERQHGELERLVDYKTDPPIPTAQVRLTDSGIEIVVRYPAVIGKLSQVDAAVTKEVLAAIRGDDSLRKTLASMPRIRAAVKS